MNSLTLQELQAHDNAPESGNGRARYRCPLPDCNGKRNRSLSVEVATGFWKCHRCGSKGRLGGAVRCGERLPPPPAPPSEPCRLKLRRVLRESGVVAITGTPGASYLLRRGIAAQLAERCRVRYARSWYRRPAVLFPVRDMTGKLVAAQGRFLQPSGDTKFITLGQLRHGVFWTPQRDGAPLVVAEAPLDAMALATLGYSAVATCGTSCPALLRAAAQGRRVLIATDADSAGDAAAQKWSDYLRLAAVSIERLRPPRGKDWNEELMLC